MLNKKRLNKRLVEVTACMQFSKYLKIEEKHKQIELNLSQSKKDNNKIKKKVIELC